MPKSKEMKEAFKQAMGRLDGEGAPPETKPTAEGEGAPEPEAIESKGRQAEHQEPPKPQEPQHQEPREPEPQPKDSDLVEVELGEGQTVQMTRDAVLEAAKLGVLVGDRQMAENAVQLESFMAGNPRAYRAISAIVQNPALAEVILEGSGSSDEGNPAGGSSTEHADPVVQALVEEVRGLRADLAAKNGGEGGAKSPEDQFAGQLEAVAKRFPALGSFPKSALNDAVQFRMSRGMTMSQAVASLAAEQGKVLTDAAGKAAERGQRAKNLQGIGGGGGAGPTSLKGPKKLNADDLASGRVLKAALESYR